MLAQYRWNKNTRSLPLSFDNCLDISPRHRSHTYHLQPVDRASPSDGLAELLNNISFLSSLTPLIEVATHTPTAG